VAVRKRTKAKTPRKSASSRKRRKKGTSAEKTKIPWAVLFWLALAFLVIVIFLFYGETIKNNIQMIYRTLTSRGAVESPVEPPSSIISPPPSAPAPQTAQGTEATPGTEAAQGAGTTQGAGTEQSTGATQGAGTTQTSEAVQGTTEALERPLHFIRIERDGSAPLVRTNRVFSASDSPMRDTLLALVAGPTDEEKLRGLSSLIPPGTRLLSVTIRDDTAYINFSEDFQYNIYDVEGYTGQLRQVIFTATEFSNIKYVQILIEGRRVDYLGENVWIGSPLSRETIQGL